MDKIKTPLYQYIPMEYRHFLSLNYLLAQKITVSSQEFANNANNRGGNEYSKIHNNKHYSCRQFFACVGRESMVKGTN